MLTYSALCSLDGFIEDEAGKFDWAEPAEDVHTFLNDLERGVGTYLLGRRTYEVMVAWETFELEGQPPYIRDFAEIWRAADKVVFSHTLEAASSERTRIERAFDHEAVRRLKEDHHVNIGGPVLAAHAFEAGLVDEVYLLVAPILVGGGKRCLPVGVRIELDLLDERRFDNGVVYLRYRTGADRRPSESRRDR
jgi:dihydrofolate reductase